MKTIDRILLFFVLPIISLLMIPPQTLLAALPFVGLAILVMIALGVMLLRGSQRALTLMIFILGLNVIIRMMLFFPHSKPLNGPVNIVFMITSIISIILSSWLLFRLDRPEIRAQTLG